MRPDSVDVDLVLQTSVTFLLGPKVLNLLRNDTIAPTADACIPKNGKPRDADTDLIGVGSY